MSGGYHHHATTWTEPMVARLHELFKEGLSCALTAKALNQQFGTQLSRNAVIGKQNRLGLIRGHAHQAKGAKRQPMKPRGDVFIPKKKFAKEPATLLVEVRAFPVMLTGLTSKTCRWPISGEGADTLFCGDLPHGEWPYCHGHGHIGYRIEAPSQKTPERILRSVRRFA